MQLTGQNRDSQAAGNDIWESCTQFSKSEMQMPWDSQSISASRMANGDGK